MTEVIEVLKQAALKAGEAVLKFKPTEGLTHKEGRGNPVTAADLASEKIIIDTIRKRFPQHQIMAEETASNVSDPLGAEHLWVIDPVDGTNNFRYGRNYSAVSIGYLQKGVIQASAVYDPFHQDLFWAERGQGTWLNGTAIKVSSLSELGKGTMAFDNSSFPEGTRRNLEIALKLPETPWCMMRGSAVLAMCDAAAGRVDLYFHTFLKPWDNAAAFLIAEEAGAIVVGLDGQPVNFLSDNVVIGNPELVKQFLEAVN